MICNLRSDQNLTLKRPLNRSPNTVVPPRSRRRSIPISVMYKFLCCIFENLAFLRVDEHSVVKNHSRFYFSNELRRLWCKRNPSPNALTSTLILEVRGPYYYKFTKLCKNDFIRRICCLCIYELF